MHIDYNALWQSFSSPGNAWRGKPFWAWNGRLEKNELLRQVRIFAEMGFGGFFMHSRTGLATEYLGPEWFDLINACAAEAEALGLEAWLYDEDRWPSGLAGGLVTCDQRYQMRSIKLEILSIEQLDEALCRPGLVAAFTARVVGVAVYDATRIDGAAQPQPAPAPAAHRRLLLFTQAPHVGQTFHNGFTYLDTLNNAATQRFLESTHERYRQHSGKRFGRSIRGIFTDEPHRGALLDGFSIPDADGHWMAPWTDALPAAFQAAFGVDLRDHLPELFLQPGGKAVWPLKWQYVELLQRMFLDNFARPCDRWCRENNLVLTGHVLHEDSLTAQSVMCGSVMRYYEHMEAPGVDVLTEGNRCFWVAKQLQSVARQVGRPWLLSELYGCTGWQMPFSAHKAVGDWQALFGINLRCHHLSWYTMQGQAKRDYPASIFYQSAWYRMYRHVETYFARLGLLLAQGDPHCAVLVINPVESVWCQVYAGWSRKLTPQSPAVRDLEEAYQTIFDALCGGQIDFDYGDEEMLARLGAVQPAKAAEHGGTAEGVLTLGKAAYRVVVVGGMTTMRGSTLRLLQEFAAAGGTVIFAGQPPAYLDAQPATLPEQLAQSCTSVPLQAADICHAVAAAMPGLPMRVQHLDGSPAADIFCQVRCGGDGAIAVAVALNVNREDACGPVRVQLRAAGVVEAWDCLTGTREAVPARQNGECLEFLETFPPGGERVYVIMPTAHAEVPARRAWQTITTTAFDGPFAYELSEPNVCVLDRARFAINGGKWQPAQEILAADSAIRAQLGLPARGGEMLQPWFVEKFHPEKISVPARTVRLSFDFCIAAMPQAPIELAMEQPGSFSARCNGQPIDLGVTSGWWVDHCIKRIPLPAAALRRGLNTLEFETLFHHGTDLEAIYLLGDFAVNLVGWHSTLVRRPQMLTVGDLAQQGFPFYSGTVRYALPGRKPPPGARHRLVLELGKFGGACAGIWAGGEQQQCIPWAPFEADITHLPPDADLVVELFLTRRNSFGPLHEFPPNRFAVGPGNFTTSGEHFREAPVLESAGLLQPPVLRVDHWA